jgi:hypothetical protein
VRRARPRPRLPTAENLCLSDARGNASHGDIILPVTRRLAFGAPRFPYPAIATFPRSDCLYSLPLRCVGLKDGGNRRVRFCAGEARANIPIGNPAVFIDIAAIWRSRKYVASGSLFCRLRCPVGPRDGSQAFARAGSVRRAGNR